MRKCPTCKSVFTDDELAFCLSDGTPLGQVYNSHETLQLTDLDIHGAETIPISPAVTAEVTARPKTIASEMPASDSPSTVVTERRDTNPARHNPWAYSTIALIALLVGGAGTLFFTGVLRPETAGNGANKLEHGPTSSEGGSASVGTRPTPADQKTHADPAAEPTPVVAAPVVGPGPGTFHVVNVAAGDVLYVRPSPGNVKASSGTIPPNATGVTVTGAAVRSGKSAWSPVSYNGVTGWVNSRFLAKD